MVITNSSTSTVAAGPTFFVTARARTSLSMIGRNELITWPVAVLMATMR